jgi:hypothetical protein
MSTKTISATIERLEDEAKHMIVEKSRQQESGLEHYFSGREAGILFALDHLKKMITEADIEKGLSSMNVVVKQDDANYFSFPLACAVFDIVFNGSPPPGSAVYTAELQNSSGERLSSTETLNFDELARMLE